MPTRNAIKTYVPGAYYHLYTRGVNKNIVFHDDQDKAYFLSLLKRYLSREPAKRSKHAPYVSFADSVDLLSYCLMDNHIHLLLYQQHGDDLPRLMRRVMTSYSMYFNERYSRVGPLFQSRYLASMINDDAYLYHISRYIHQNPSKWRTYQFSSLRYYTGDAQSDWVKPAKILELFDDDSAKYMAFLDDPSEVSDSFTDQLAHE